MTVALKGIDSLYLQFSSKVEPFSVPVLRVYGYNNGQKTCVHLHQVYPYFYIRYHGDLGAVDAYISSLGRSLNHACQASFGKEFSDDASKQIVAAIVLVKGLPYYGFNLHCVPFLKIYLLNPSLQTRIVSLLESGSIMGRVFEVYDAHIPYILQFLVDYNLSGMDSLDLSFVKFRGPILEVRRNTHLLEPIGQEHPCKNAYGHFTNELVQSMVWPLNPKRKTYCEVEVDAWASDILNRTRIKPRLDSPTVTLDHLKRSKSHSISSLTNSLVPSLAAIWDDEQQRRTRRGIPLEQPPASMAKSQRYPNCPWHNEARLRDQLKAKLEAMEFDHSSLENLLTPPVDLADVPTALAAISWLHPPSRRYEFSIQDGQVFAQEIQTFALETGTPPDNQVTFDNHAEFLSQRYSQHNSVAQTDINADLIVVDESQTIPDQDTEELLEWMGQDEDILDHDDVTFSQPIPDADTIEALECMQESLSQSSVRKISQFDGPADDPGPPLKKRRVKSRVAREPLPLSASQRLQNISQEEIHSSPALDWNLSSLLSPSRPQSTVLFNEVPTVHSPTNSSSLPQFVPMTPTEKSQKTPKLGRSVSFNLPESILMKSQSIITIGTPKSDGSIITNNATPKSTTTIETPKSEGPTRTKPSILFKYGKAPPSAAYLAGTFSLYGLPQVIHQEPFFSKSKDVPARSRQYAGREFRLVGTDVSWLPDWESAEPVNTKWTQSSAKSIPWKPFEYWKRMLAHSTSRVYPRKKIWRFPQRPPSASEIREWLVQHPVKVTPIRREPSQIEGPTQANAFGFKYSQLAVSSEKSKNGLSLLSVEIHTGTTKGNVPDPKTNPICCIFYALQDSDSSRFKTNGRRPGYYLGMLAVKDAFPKYKTGMSGFHIQVLDSERALFKEFINLVRSFDPDILLGYEVHSSSWGYLVERAEFAFKMDMLQELARVHPKEAKSHHTKEEDDWGFKKQSSLHASGRIFLNVWRLMKRELNLTSYTVENVAFHVLHQRIPRYSTDTLSDWWSHGMLMRWRTLQYYFDRVQLNLDLLDDTEFINRTSQFARVYGIDFYSVIIRGSQFKVESVMARLARPEGFIMLSPSRQRVAKMRALECIPLVMEPRSEFYTSPVLVLDFASLYPSMMIAYNYCYSTVLGRISTIADKRELGSLESFILSPEVVETLKDHVNVAPNGVVFVKPHIRQGVLGRMLKEILDTRVMVKKSMKLYKGEKGLLRLLDAQQLSLKLLANVTYGYTSASFSGRMPMTEIADAIVQSGRATLERAIEMIHSNPSWNARVVYGDTDSLFVHLEGVSKSRAFDIGDQIVESIAKANPEPVKLKFEKVYHPCVLLAKKRYVGAMYETRSVTEAVFDAKGIETVRRDGCPAVAKSMEATLKLLFRTKDLSQVKEYLYRQWTKIITGNVALEDFIIAKAVKLGSYTGPTLPPGAHLSTKKMEKDSRLEPQYGERVPYCVIHGVPGHRLVDAVVSPEDLARNPSLRLHGTYYITKQIIPALSRVFNLVGADIEKWFADMPKVFKAIAYTPDQLVENVNILPMDQLDQLGVVRPVKQIQGRTIDQFYVPKHCIICSKVSQVEICSDCELNPPNTLNTLTLRIKESESKFRVIQEVCRSCTTFSTALDADIPCISLDCPVFFARLKAQQQAGLISKWNSVIERVTGPLEESRQSAWLHSLEF